MNSLFELSIFKWILIAKYIPLVETRNGEQFIEAWNNMYTIKISKTHLTHLQSYWKIFSFHICRNKLIWMDVQQILSWNSGIALVLQQIINNTWYHFWTLSILTMRCCILPLQSIWKLYSWQMRIGSIKYRGRRFRRAKPFATSKYK